MAKTRLALMLPRGGRGELDLEGVEGGWRREGRFVLKDGEASP